MTAKENHNLSRAGEALECGLRKGNTKPFCRKAIKQKLEQSVDEGSTFQAVQVELDNQAMKTGYTAARIDLGQQNESTIEVQLEVGVDGTWAAERQQRKAKRWA